MRFPKSLAFFFTLAAVLVCSPGAANDNTMELPPDVRAWFRNPDGSCVQCSIGMCGTWSNVPSAATLLWSTEYGPAVRGGSNPQRVAAYAQSRGIKLYNVTGDATFEWMKWASKTGRFAAIGAGTRHFQTLYRWDETSNTWYVCNNNSTQKIDSYTWEQFKRLHYASGPWVVILDTPSVPPVPRYR